MKFIEVKDNKIIFETTNKSVVRELGAIGTNKKNQYYVFNSIESVGELFCINDREFSEVYEDTMSEEYAIKYIKEKEDTKGLDKLRPYQRVDCSYIMNNARNGFGSAIFNEMRTGKTPTSLVANDTIWKDLHGQKGKIIIACESGHKYKWQEEVKKWTGFKPVIIKGTPTQRTKKEYPQWVDGTALIISHSTLASDEINGLLPKDPILSLIVDEGHFLRYLNIFRINKSTRNAKGLYMASKRASYKFILTGTPAPKQVIDIIPQLQFIYGKNLFPKWPMVEYFFNKEYSPFNKFGTPSTIKYEKEDEWKSILNRYCLQRKAKSVMTWIPKIIKDQPVVIKMSAKQKKAYNEMKKHFERTLKDGTIVEEETVLSQLTRLRQIMVDPSTLDIDSPSAKSDWLLKYIEDNPNKKIIIASWFTSFLKVFKERVKEPTSMIIGEQSAMAKDKAEKDFQSGKTRIILCNLQAGSKGWTLDSGDVMIFTDRYFNPDFNEQMEFRFVPTTENSNTNPKEIIDVLVDNSIDLKLNKAINERKSILEIVNDFKKDWKGL